MTGMVLGLLAETPLHPGSGQTGGAVDLPVSREAKTGYPVIYGSGMKGALRDKWRQEKEENGASKLMNNIFGHKDGAGGLAITDGRLLLLPIRSLNGHFKLATCPYLLNRYKRDLALLGLATTDIFSSPIPSEKKVVTAIAIEGNLYLEEYIYEPKRESLDDIINELRKLIGHREVQDSLPQQLIILSDGDFSHFAKHGLPIVARNALNEQTKISKNLWYEEHLPPDTLLYSLVIPRKGAETALTELKEFLDGSRYLQVGGNETIGQGWCILQTSSKEGGGQHENSSGTGKGQA